MLIFKYHSKSIFYRCQPIPIEYSLYPFLIKIWLSEPFIHLETPSYIVKNIDKKLGGERGVRKNSLIFIVDYFLTLPLKGSLHLKKMELSITSLTPPFRPKFWKILENIDFREAFI